MAEEAGKLPLRRLEPPILKFIKVAIPTDLERLHQHQHNIEKVQSLTHEQRQQSPAYGQQREPCVCVCGHHRESSAEDLMVYLKSLPVSLLEQHTIG